jgi:hypothetical protein
MLIKPALNKGLLQSLSLDSKEIMSLVYWVQIWHHSITDHTYYKILVKSLILVIPVISQVTNRLLQILDVCFLEGFMYFRTSKLPALVTMVCRDVLHFYYNGLPLYSAMNVMMSDTVILWHVLPCSNTQNNGEFWCISLSFLSIHARGRVTTTCTVEMIPSFFPPTECAEQSEI